MIAGARRLQQPGPKRAERWLTAVGPLRQLDFTLERGLTLNEALSRPLLAEGLAGGVVELEGGGFGPFAYVIPALSADPRYAAFYSDTRQPPEGAAIERGVATFGSRDGLPFVHCHAVWREAGGERRGGHVLPLDTVVREPIRARAFGTGAASFTVLPDAETNFSLFTPLAAQPAPPGGRRLVLLKVQPNEPVDAAILAACRAHGIHSAAIRGLGSLVGVAFADGRDVPSVATELFLRSGQVGPGRDGRDGVELGIAVVDTAGTIHEGRLAPGNLACITCELCLVEEPDEA